MGRKVAISLRIMPESADSDVEGIARKLNEIGFELKDTKIVPIAFGLKAIEAVFLLPDEANASEHLEEKIKGIEGVSDVETVSVTLV